MIKKYNEFFSWKNFPEKTIDELVPEDVLFSKFKEVGYSCNPKDNPINDVIYDDVNNDRITCSFTSFAYGGEYGKDLSQRLQQIADSIGATDLDIDHTGRVIFYFDFDKYPELKKSE
jgi:hypothetical protein